MDIILSNSLKRNKEVFLPIDEKNVRMYVCGPTVYDRAHIGNARAVVVFDVLYRVLRHKYGAGNVTYVRNITDVDDKINAAAQAQGIDISELTAKTTAAFHADMAALNCLSPSIEPRATGHIAEMVAMIGRLIANGNAYAAESHVLFRVASDPDYGHLSGRSTEQMLAGARVEVAPYKENPMDFVLWKPSKPAEPGWDSPWGRGRPGWHIECSAMSHKHLGENFDIHGGGADLTFPHHENEIAQSTCAYPGSKFAGYWVHNGFLSVNGEKMSKSLGNFVTVGDLLYDNNTDGKVTGEIIRLALISTHYRKPLDWTSKAFQDAEKTLSKFYKLISESNEIDGEIPEEFIEAMYDDLNTPKAISILHNLEKEGRAGSLKKCANMLGLLNIHPTVYMEWKSKGFVQEVNDDDKPVVYINGQPIPIENLINARKAARANKNWAESDRIRDELAAVGIIVEDKPGGAMSWRLK